MPHHSRRAACSGIAVICNCWVSFPSLASIVASLFSLHRNGWAAAAGTMSASEEWFRRRPLWQLNLSVLSRRSASLLLTALACKTQTQKSCQQCRKTRDRMKPQKPILLMIAPPISFCLREMRFTEDVKFSKYNLSTLMKNRSVVLCYVDFANMNWQTWKERWWVEERPA